MTQSRKPRSVAAGVLAVALVAAVAVAPAIGQSTQGPSSSETPYIVPVADGVEVVSILTVGDTPTNDDDYRMVGIPDGLGAFSNSRRHHGHRTFTLLSNHELVGASGHVRDHGATGAFVSMWTINSRTLEVIDGQDLIQRVRTNADGDQVWNAAAPGIAISRLCSGDLPAQSALYNRSTRRGYSGKIFFSGEETGSEGRAFAHVLDGTSWELPHLGNMSYENILLNPSESDKTIAIATDDSTPGQVYVYVGTKTRTGNPIQRAGLANGPLYGIKVAGMTAEPNATLAQTPTRFSLARITDAAQKTGAEIETASDTLGVTEFLRPEDGAWDPRRPRDFYFVTTDNFDSAKPSGAGSVGGGSDGYSRLWRLRFDNLRRPESGGTITPLLDGRSEPVQMLDNMTVTGTGHVLIQEDPGNQTYNAMIWLYTIATDTLTVVAQHDRARFGDIGLAPVAQPSTVDEESSGIIPAFDILGDGWFLLDVQAHTAPRPPHSARVTELVEDGQYVALYVPQTDKDDDDDDDD